jgi:hypothetical protein
MQEGSSALRPQASPRAAQAERNFRRAFLLQLRRSALSTLTLTLIVSIRHATRVIVFQKPARLVRLAPFFIAKPRCDNTEADR